jgi:hypothetical protein
MVALGLQLIAYQLPTSWPGGGLQMALAGFVLDFIIHHSTFILRPGWTSSFIILPSSFAPGVREPESYPR